MSVKVLIGQAVFLQRESSPAVDAAQSHLSLINQHICQVGLFYFVGVALDFARTFIQRLYGVVQSRSGEGCLCFDFQTVSTDIQHAPPTQVGLVAVFLWTDVGIELAVHALAVTPQEGVVVTVSIVFYGAASVIFQGFERAGHLKLHAEAEQVGHFRPFVGFQLLGHLDGTLVIDDIGQGQLSLNGGNVISGLYYGQSVFTTLFEGGQFQFGIEPYAVAVLEACAEVIVCGGPPEVGLQDAAFFQVGKAVDFVEAKEAIVFVEFDAEILARHDEVVAVVFADDRLYHLFVVSGFVGESLGGRFVGIQHQLVSGYGMSGGAATRHAGNKNRWAG